MITGSPPPKKMKLVIDYSGERWIILVLVYGTYLATERFWTTLLICSSIDLFVWVATSSICAKWWSEAPNLDPDITTNAEDIVNYRHSALIDFALRLGVIMGGLVINAFSGYAFDLTFYRGYAWILVFITFFVYCWFRFTVAMLSEWRTNSDAERQLVLIDPRYPWTPVSLRSDKEADIVREQAKWHVLMFFLVFAAVCCTETIVFSEPWTFATFFSYVVSVWFLIIVGDASRMNGQGYWWSFLGFLGFWLILIVGSVLFVDIERKHDVSVYFAL